MRIITTFLTIASILLVASPASAAPPPDRLNYQGVLRDSAGVPIDATHDVVFRLFDAAYARAASRDGAPHG